MPEQCQRCAACCTNPAMPIALLPSEYRRIKSFLSRSNLFPKSREWAGAIAYSREDEFSKVYCFKVTSNRKVKKAYFGIVYNQEGRCPFLKGRNHCTIYNLRPLGCRTFFCKHQQTAEEIRGNADLYVKQVQYRQKVTDWNRKFNKGNTLEQFDQAAGFHTGIKKVRTKNFINNT